MKKNYLYNLSLSLANILFPILSFPYASRILEPEGIGKVQVVSSFAQYFALIAALGIPVYGIQEIAKYRHNKKELSAVFSELIIIYFITSVLISFVYLAVIYSFPFFRPNLQLYLYAVCIILLGFSSIDWLYAGLEAFRIISIRSVIIKALALVLLYVFVKEKADYEKYLLILIFSILGNNIINLFMIRNRCSLVFKNLAFKQHFRPMFFIFGTTIASSIYTYLDSVLLGMLANEHAVGFYTAAIKLAKIAIPIIISIGAVLVPRLAKNFSTSNFTEIQQLLNKSFQFISFSAIPITFGLALLAPEFILIFSGSKFLPAVPCMQILSVLPLIISLGYFFAFQILIPAGKSREVFVAAVTGVVTGLLLNFIFIPFYGENGAAVANISCEVLVLLVYIYYARKYFKLQYHWHLFYRSTVSALLFIPVIWFIRQVHFPVLWTLLLCIAVCGILYSLVQFYLFKNQFIAGIRNTISQKLQTFKH